MPNFDAEREYKKKRKISSFQFSTLNLQQESSNWKTTKKRITVSSKLTLLKNIMLTSFVIFKVFLLNFCVYITGF